MDESFNFTVRSVEPLGDGAIVDEFFDERLDAESVNEALEEMGDCSDAVASFWNDD